MNKIKDNSRATIYFGQELGEYLDDLVSKTGLSKSEIVCEALRNHKITILEEGKEIAGAFVKICDLASGFPKESRINLDENIEKELNKTCKLLESLLIKISQNAG